MAGLTITGAEGVLRWGYSSAGTLRAWTIRRTDDGHRELTATVASLDDFAVSQRPLWFVATHALGVWKWPIEELLQSANGELTARLGSRKDAL